MWVDNSSLLFTSIMLLFSGVSTAVRKEFLKHIHSLQNFLCNFNYRFPVKVTDMNLGVHTERTYKVLPVACITAE